ncbi:hypothetical protein MIR68_010106 [Amoeboaphelidium protococcarum]|nr:hypothetical protein MIR68_010106 [Amoeboaphelidium protococcarum]
MLQSNDKIHLLPGVKCTYTSSTEIYTQQQRSIVTYDLAVPPEASNATRYHFRGIIVIVDAATYQFELSSNGFSKLQLSTGGMPIFTLQNSGFHLRSSSGNVTLYQQMYEVELEYRLTTNQGQPVVSVNCFKNEIWDFLGISRIRIDLSKQLVHLGDNKRDIMAEALSNRSQRDDSAVCFQSDIESIDQDSDIDDGDGHFLTGNDKSSNEEVGIDNENQVSAMRSVIDDYEEALEVMDLRYQVQIEKLQRALEYEKLRNDSLLKLLSQSTTLARQMGGRTQSLNDHSQSPSAAQFRYRQSFMESPYNQSNISSCQVTFSDGHSSGTMLSSSDKEIVGKHMADIDHLKLLYFQSTALAIKLHMSTNAQVKVQQCKSVKNRLSQLFCTRRKTRSVDLDLMDLYEKLRSRHTPVNQWSLCISDFLHEQLNYSQ